MSETLTKPEVTTARWKAVIYYRSEALGLVDVEHGIEELEELQDIVERGPDWNTIDRITITLDRSCEHGLTIEQAGGE
jgi:hypothetical protein